MVGIYPGGICPGGICPAGICPAGICPDTVKNVCVQFLHKTATLIYAVKPPLTTYLAKGSEVIPHHKA